MRTDRLTEALATAVDTAFERGDSWYLLTALGLDEQAFGDAVDEIARVEEYEGSMAGLQLLDLGCGVGRHLLAAADRGAETVGVDASPLLLRVASDLVPSATFQLGDIHSVGDDGDFDIVLIMSDTLTLAETTAGVEAILRTARSYLRDNGLLVIVVDPAEVCDGSRTWEERLGLQAVETITARAQPSGGRAVLHTFEITRGERTHNFIGNSVVHSVAEVRALARQASLCLENIAPVRDDGDLMLFLRAEPGFNYLSDLGPFLQSWADRDHWRNRPTGSPAPTSTGRLTFGEGTGLGRGESLSRHHPDFYRHIEPAVLPLVRAAVEDWNQISYSSCEGHLVPHPSRETYTECYVGLVALSHGHADILRSAFAPALDGGMHLPLVCDVLERDLLGPVGKVGSVNLHLRRARGQRWTSYSRERDETVATLVTAMSAAVGGSLR